MTRARTACALPILLAIACGDDDAPPPPALDQIEVELVDSDDEVAPAAVYVRLLDDYVWPDDETLVLGVYSRAIDGDAPLAFTGTVVTRELMTAVFVVPEIEEGVFAADVEVALQFGEAAESEGSLVFQERGERGDVIRLGRVTYPDWDTPLPAARGPCRMGETPRDCFRRQLGEWLRRLCEPPDPALAALCESARRVAETARLGDGPNCSIGDGVRGQTDGAGQVTFDGGRLLFGPLDCGFGTFIHESSHAADAAARPPGQEPTCADLIRGECNAYLLPFRLAARMGVDPSQGRGLQWAFATTANFYVQLLSRKIDSIRSRCNRLMPNLFGDPANVRAMCDCLREVDAFARMNGFDRYVEYGFGAGVKRDIREAREQLGCP